MANSQRAFKPKNIESTAAARHDSTNKFSPLKLRHHWIMVIGYIKFQNFVSQAFE